MSFHAFISHYGYLGIFSILMLGIFGVPFPDESLLTFSGYLASKGHLHIVLTILVAFVGTSLGITVNYLVGRTLGFAAVRKYGHRFHLTPARMDKVNEWFDWLGKWLLPVSYFIPGVRHLTPFVAGASKLRFKVFAIFAYAGGFLWTIAFTLTGYFLGHEPTGTKGQFSHFLIFAGIVLLFIALYLQIQMEMEARGKGKTE
jgi:membrane protein DedA with SNARE-associated domain|uniref:DedA family protein n=1 Tax=Desulfobacca acetoxidans TaxID=60893 RepID=A0A7V6DQQ8_9BACT